MARILGQVNTGGGRVLGQVQPQSNPLTGNQFEQNKPTSFLGKARDFSASIIGGGKLAEGLGQSIVAPSIQKSFSESQETTSSLQDQLLKRLKEKRKAGEDTSRLEKAYEKSKKLNLFQRDLQSDFSESLVSDKEVAGSALRLGGTLAGGALLGGVSSKMGFGLKASKGLKTIGGVNKLFGVGKATTFTGGALRGAGAGATAGAVEGAVHGAGLGLEENKDLKGVSKSAGVGALIGGATGGVLGGITGGITGVLNKSKLSKENFTRELVQPKETAKVKAQAIKEGRLEDPTFLGKAKITPSGRELKLANSVEDVVSSKASVGQNIDAIRLKVSNTNTGIKSYIEKNKVPFNTSQLGSKLNSAKDDLNLIFASDKQAEKTFNAVVKEFMKGVDKKDTLGLFTRRQSFDQIPAIKKLLQTDRLGENARREIVLAVRKSANEYVASLLPKGNKFTPNLLNEHYMLEAIGNIAESNANIIGKNKLQILVNEYPVLKWVVGGLVGGASVGVGGSIIGSVD